MSRKQKLNNNWDDEGRIPCDQNQLLETHENN